ncbi:hypothetical protein GBAR_LOCUS25144 [Geodia barretti]|uniref:Light-independent protochlorophyllide reductase subunit B-like C-terminal domain-containing protein n=1 Tax=Geodia barretti TaxID=519541 RepID=A0AA35TCL0_GEOBA|nr:hypothetical protein GBAR_LOCUS25144 [Geodia barretti]
MAMEAIMPQRASEKLTRVAKEIAEQKVLESDAVQTYICGECGYAAHNQQPVKCPVCSSLPERFQMVDKSSLQHVAVDEGGTAEEETFDGVRLQWSEQSKKALRRVPRGYMRRNVKARIEKSARSQKIATITNAFATEIIDDSMGEAAAVREDAPELRAVQAQTDAQNVDVVQGFESPVQWTEEAIERLNLVPAGFMRNITQTRIEQRAQENDVPQVTLDFAARVIEDGRSLANEVLGQYYQQPDQD